MDWSAYTTLEFVPPDGHHAQKRSEKHGFVYIWFFCVGEEEFPFYVGETYRIWGRVDDYYWASFQAPTDFKVGEALRYLGSEKISVKMRFRAVADRNAEEKKLLREFGKPNLLNSLTGYDYAVADQSNEREEVRNFVRGLVQGVRKDQSSPLND
jgi:hypothetical protein